MISDPYAEAKLPSHPARMIPDVARISLILNTASERMKLEYLEARLHLEWRLGYQTGLADAANVVKLAVESND